MPGQAAFIAVDWGTTNSRFWLCDGAGAPLDARHGQGVAPLRGTGRFGEVFDEVTAGWPESVPAVLCGTIGANIGWRQVGYRPCPAALTDGASNALSFVHGARIVTILAGVTARNLIDEPDLMRGEETQLAGVVAAGEGDGLYVLPGTHNKWVLVEGGAITRFHTSMSGELYGAIAGHTILLVPGAGEPGAGTMFDHGVRNALRHGAAGFATLLFSVRTRQVLGEMAESDAASYLSGLVIGADVAGGQAMLAEAGSATLVGGAALAASYARAIELAGGTSRSIAGDAAVLTGLALAWRQLSA
ncbi:MAG: 2-dehydro-3-deoxygalactonokinase [Sphingomonadales bacterium]|nr:2-dehydro-3-deoxygalactonokinase [Sphingomonadales bacterium]